MLKPEKLIGSLMLDPRRRKMFISEKIYYQIVNGNKVTIDRRLPFCNAFGRLLGGSTLELRHVKMAIKITEHFSALIATGKLRYELKYCFLSTCGKADAPCLA
jgi:hypothetical protein